MVGKIPNMQRISHTTEDSNLVRVSKISEESFFGNSTYQCLLWHIYRTKLAKKRAGNYDKSIVVGFCSHSCQLLYQCELSSTVWSIFCFYIVFIHSQWLDLSSLHYLDHLQVQNVRRFQVKSLRLHCIKILIKQRI